MISPIFRYVVLFDFQIYLHNTNKKQAAFIFFDDDAACHIIFIEQQLLQRFVYKFAFVGFCVRFTPTYEEV